MEFIVRYWVATAPVPFDGHKWDDPAWISHSTHPATRLGLRNAILAAEDRLAVLHMQDGDIPHGCDIFLTEGEKIVILSVHEADEVLGMLDRGEFTCASLGKILTSQDGHDEEPHPDPSVVSAPQTLPQTAPHPGVASYIAEEELPVIHRLDVDV